MVDSINTRLGMGPSGRQTLIQSGLVVGAAGAVIQALTIATSCAHAEWGSRSEKDDASSAVSLGQAVVWGQAAGAIAWWLVSDVFGRRETCCLCCVVMSASTAAASFASSYELFRACCVGVGFGLAGAALAPTLLVVERAPARFRGRCVVGLGLFGTVGSLLAMCAHSTLEAAGSSWAWWGILGSSDDAPRWRTLCATMALLPFAAGISVSNYLEESIPWLVLRRKLSSARLAAEKAAVRNHPRGSRRLVTEMLYTFDAVLAAVDGGDDLSLRESSGDECGRASRRFATNLVNSVKSSCRAAAVCGWGLAFLVAFGLVSVISLVRLEFDGNESARDAAFFVRDRRRASYTSLFSASFGVAKEEKCPAIDFSVAFSALSAELVGIAFAAHAVDVVGRRPALSVLCAAATAGVLVLAAPEYFPDTLGDHRPSRPTLVAAMMTARGALAAGAVVVGLVVAETRSACDRAAASSFAYVFTRLGALLSTYWVVSPNPISTISLLVTLVDVSAAWAALAFPIEPNAMPTDALVPKATSGGRKQYRLVGQVDLEDVSVASVLVAATQSQRHGDELENSQTDAASLVESVLTDGKRTVFSSSRDTEVEEDDYDQGDYHQQPPSEPSSEKTPLLASPLLSL